MQLTIACLQITSGNDMDANIAAIDAMAREAAVGGATLICLPENAFYMKREAHHKDECAQVGPGRGSFETSAHPGVIATQALAKELGVWILIGSIAAIDPQTNDKRPFNRSLLIDDAGHIASIYDKIHLFDMTFSCGASFVESARMQAGTKAVIAQTPFGKIGMSVCYDLRFPHLYRDMAQAGAGILTVPSAFAHVTGEAHWHTLLKARAIENSAFVIAPGQCGEHPGGRNSYGHSLIIDPWGRVLADGGEDVGIVTATIDVGDITTTRGNMPSLHAPSTYVVE